MTKTECHNVISSKKKKEKKVVTLVTQWISPSLHIGPGFRVSLFLATLAGINRSAAMDFARSAISFSDGTAV